MNSSRWMEAITKALVNGSNVSQLFLKRRTSDPPSFRCLFCFKWIISKDVSGLLGNAIIRGYKGTVTSELRLKEHPKKTQTLRDCGLPCLVWLEPSLGNCFEGGQQKTRVSRTDQVPAPLRDHPVRVKFRVPLPNRQKLRGTLRR
jgi:hypothetical protein